MSFLFLKKHYIIFKFVNSLLSGLTNFNPGLMTFLKPSFLETLQTGNIWFVPLETSTFTSKFALYKYANFQKQNIKDLKLFFNFIRYCTFNFKHSECAIVFPD